MRTPMLMLSLLMSVAQFTSGQASMSSTGSGSFLPSSYVSNFTDAATRNVWHPVTASLTSVYAGNGVTLGINSAHTGYVYNDYSARTNPNTWTPHPEWGSVYGLWEPGDGNIYALYGPGGGGCINEGFHSLGRWNGSGFTQLTYCFAQATFSQDRRGLILLIDGNGVLWGATGFGASGYAHYPLPTGYTSVISMAAISASPAVWEVITPDNKIWEYNGTSYSQLTSTGRGSQIAADADANVYVIGVGSDTSVYHLNTARTGFDHLTGTGYTSIAVGGGPFNVFGVGPTAGGYNVYRFSELGIQISRQYQGNVGCNTGVPPALCNTFTHAVNLQICVQGHCGNDQTQNFNGPGSWGRTATVTANDVFGCLDDFLSCGVTESQGRMQCSGGGSNNDNPPALNPTLELANVRTATSNVNQASDWLGRHVYTIVNYCGPTPDANIGGNEPNTIKYWTTSVNWFDMEDLCFSWTGHNPWICQAHVQGWKTGNVEETYVGVDPGPGDNFFCTSNP